MFCVYMKYRQNIIISYHVRTLQRVRNLWYRASRASRRCEHGRGSRRFDRQSHFALDFIDRSLDIVHLINSGLHLTQEPLDNVQLFFNFADLRFRFRTARLKIMAFLDY